MIRKATEKDLREVSRLWEMMVLEKKPEWSPNKQWWRDIARKLLKAGFYTIYVSIIDGIMVGFGDYFMWNEPATGKLHSVGQHIYVKPSHRKTWCAAGLLKRWKTDARQKGAEIIEMFAFPSEVEMWGRLGFNKVRVLMRMEV